jgi:hypothetical protein
MNLKGLIDRQIIIIDDHRRGSKEIKSCDDQSADIHIDKQTNYPVDGKRQKVRIKVPINSERNISIENAKGQHLNKIPRQLRNEINKAFQNKVKRERFIKDLIETLRDFPTILNDRQRLRQILNNLSKHFDLKWSEEIITTYTDDVLTVYTEYYLDKNGNLFFITVDKVKIKLGQTNNKYARN